MRIRYMRAPPRRMRAATRWVRRLTILPRVLCSWAGATLLAKITKSEPAPECGAHAPTSPHRQGGWRDPIPDHLLRSGVASTADQGLLRAVPASGRAGLRHRSPRRQPGAHVPPDRSTGGGCRAATGLRGRAAGALRSRPGCRPRGLRRGRRSGSRRAAPQHQDPDGLELRRLLDLRRASRPQVPAGPLGQGRHSALGHSRRPGRAAWRATVLQDRRRGLRGRRPCGPEPLAAGAVGRVHPGGDRAGGRLRLAPRGGGLLPLPPLPRRDAPVGAQGWLGAEEMVDLLRALPVSSSESTGGRSGDVYAVRRDRLSLLADE